jgi:hypothetical protein
MSPAVSVKHSKQEAGNSSRAKFLRRTTLHSRDDRNPSTEYGSRQQSPPIRSPLTQHVKHIPTQTEIIRMRLRPLKPGLMPPLKRRHAIVTNPVVAPEHHQLSRRSLNRRPATPRQVSSSRSIRAASDAQTASGQAHCPTPNQGAPWSKRGAPPATAHTPAKTPPHHRGQPNRQRRTSTTRPESVR